MQRLSAELAGIYVPFTEMRFDNLGREAIARLELMPIRRVESGEFLFAVVHLPYTVAADFSSVHCAK